MNVGLEQYLHKCLDLLSENWNSQNNREERCEGNGGMHGAYKK